MARLLTGLIEPRVLRPLFWLLAVFSLVMAMLPNPPTLPIDRFGDKFAHILAFATLAGVANLAWRETRVWTIGWRLALFGAAIEVFQSIPALHRDSDVRDWIADSLAIIAASLAMRWLIARIARG